MNLLRIGFLLIFIVTVFRGNAEKLVLHTDDLCKVWWAGSTYKIMRNDSTPREKGGISIRAAKNETESFQVVLSPAENLENVSVTISGFENKDGRIIPSENITIRKVEYVHVTKPSGKLHKRGWYPDPLPLLDAPFNTPEGINTPLWFTVKVPKDATFGKYKATIRFQSSAWQAEIPLELEVWDFHLPDFPYMRSGFGLGTSRIRQYHNLETDKELEVVLDKYFRSFKDYRISPYYFYDQKKIKKTIKGINWTGGIFDPDEKVKGRYAYQLEPGKKGRFSHLIKIDPSHQYHLKWQAKSVSKNQRYTVSVKCYDEDKNLISRSLKWMSYYGNENWRQDTMFIDTTGFFAEIDLPDYRPFPENTGYASIHLDAPSNGEVWFDDFQFIDVQTGENLLPHGDFEQKIEDLDMNLDFSDFDKAARKYLDEFGFSGFRFDVPGLSKTSSGINQGFKSGTPEYKKLMKLYLKGVQDHLEENGWLGKEYLYWADEPDKEHYKYVREGMEAIHNAAPKLTRFITENNPGPEIMDVTEIGCPVLYKVDPEKTKEWSAKGRQFWSYLMCWPKDPHVNLFIDSHAINLRMWLWISYKYKLEGILVWNSNQWNGVNKGAYPAGSVQNIWEDPMTYKSGWGTPYESAPEFGNGDGMFFYPPNRYPNSDKTKYLEGPVPSLRLEILRDGLDDYDYMRMLEECIKQMPEKKALVKKAKKLLDFGSDIFENDTIYTKDPEVLIKYRVQMGEVLEAFNRNM